MKSKKEYRTTVHALRDIDPVKVGVPSVAGRLAGEGVSPGIEDARLVTPGIGVRTPGQTTHE